MRIPIVACVLVVCLPVAHASAQSEDVEPRVIGRPGTMMVGLSGFADRVSSPEESLPINYTAQIDICRFVSRRIAVRVGAVGSGSAGGDGADDLRAGSGAPSINATGGVLFYLTPASIVSPYVGAEYWAQLTQRSGRDLGSMLGTAGVQAAVSSRASFFVQGGFGARLNRGEDNKLLTRFVAQLGLRIRL